MHRRIPERGKWLKQDVTGFFAYHAVPTDFRALQAFRDHVKDLWRRSLKRRSQRDRTTWQRITKLLDDFLRNPASFAPDPAIALPSSTRGGSRVPESAPLGSVRGAPSNERPYPIDCPLGPGLWGMCRRPTQSNGRRFKLPEVSVGLSMLPNRKGPQREAGPSATGGV
jgi:hypothetical protein